MRTLLMVGLAVSVLAAAPVYQRSGRIGKGGKGRPATSVANCTPNVADLQSTTVQTAITNASAGATICLPAGSATWSAYMEVYPAPAANITVMGQTTCTGAGQTLACTDNTIITSGVDQSGGERAMFRVFVPGTGTFRLSGITVRGGTYPNWQQNGVVVLSAYNTNYPLVRVDHVHFDNAHSLPLSLNSTAGVIDHTYFDMPSDGSSDNGFKAIGIGDDAWAAATDFGTVATWTYVEDSYFNHGGAMNDCYSAGKQVFRYNYATDTGVQEHGTGHAVENRGCRAMEVYNNAILGGAHSATTSVGLYTGTAMVFSNSTSGMNSFIQYAETRQSNYTYSQFEMPSGFGYCGTQSHWGAGSDPGSNGSVWDGNTDASGYPCLDQIGRGIGDTLNNSMPTKANSTRGCTVNFAWTSRALVGSCGGGDATAWPRQALEPVYEFLNTGSVAVGWSIVYRNPANTANIVVNRDFYSSTSSASCSSGGCTSGIGTGTRASRPATCTAGVAWWSTDQGGNWDTTHGGASDGTLDVCTATNTWTNAVYTPYHYPYQ